MRGLQPKGRLRWRSGGLHRGEVGTLPKLCLNRLKGLYCAWCCGRTRRRMALCSLWNARCEHLQHARRSSRRHRRTRCIVCDYWPARSTGLIDRRTGSPADARRALGIDQYPRARSSPLSCSVLPAPSRLDASYRSIRDASTGRNHLPAPHLIGCSPGAWASHSRRRRCPPRPWYR